MARPRVVLDDDAWAAVRVAYEDTDEAVHRIGFRFGISRVRIYDQAAKDGWRMRSERTVRCVADVPPPRPQPLPVSVLVLQSEAEEATSNFDQSSSPMPSEASQHIDWTGQTHEQRLERLFRIIDQLLARLESTMTRNPNMTPQDHEKTARAVTQTVTALERVIDFSDPKKAPETSDGGKNNDSAEAERMRREIAERLERLSAKLHDGTGKSE
jgi:hypothetical protein